MVEIRPALPGDSWLILPDLRPEEVREFEALGVTSEECMRAGMACSEAVTMFIDGEPAGMFGIADYGDHRVPWGVFTRAIERHPLAFLRATKHWISTRLGGLVNYVDARNERAVKWFAWLGFTVSEPEPYGPAGELFHRVSA